MNKRLEMLLALFLPCACWAAGEPSTVDSLDRFPVYEMKGITVTATRVPDRLADVPMGVQVMDADEIEESGARDAGELLRDAVGLDARDFGATGSVSTLSVRGSTASQVLVLVDGRPINSASLGTADLSEISLGGARRVEVVRGPASSLYGANALGGVVNIIRGPAAAAPYMRGTAEFGSFGNQFYSLSSASSWRGAGLSLSGDYRSAGGDRENSDYDSRRFSGKLTYDGFEMVKPDLSAGIEWFELGLPGPVPREGHVPGYGSSDVTSRFDRQNSNRAYLDFGLNASLNGARAKAKIYYDWRDMDARLIYDSWDSVRSVEEDEYITNVAGVNLQFELAPWDKDRFIVGLDGVLSRLDASSAVTPDSGGAATTEWTPRDTVVGLYAENQWRPLENTGLTLSGRYDYSEAYGSRISPTAGIVLSPGPRFRLKASIGSAFRAPTLNDLFWPESQFGGGNPELEPETGVGSEARIECEPLQFLAAAVSLVRRDVKDMIEWGVAQDGKWRPINVNEFHSTAVEAEIEYTAGELLELRGSYFYLHALEKTEVFGEGLVERRAAYRPKTSGSCGANCRTPNGLDFLVELRYSGPRVKYFQTDEKWLGESFVTDLGAGFDLGPQRFFLKVQNLFDYRFSEQFGYELADGDYPAPARTFLYGTEIVLH